MEGENGTPQITLNGNHAGRKHESPGVPQPKQEVSYLSQGRTRDRMAIGVIPLTINGPSHLIYCARGWTARQQRLHRDCGVEARGSGKSLESRHAWSLSRLRSGERWQDRGKRKRSWRADRTTGGVSESWSRSENQGQWAQCGATRVSSVPVEARSVARTLGMIATGGNA